MLVTAARWLCPVASPPVEEGALLTHEGKIVAAGPRAAVLERAGAATPVVELGSVALLPGLINAHCHSELSWMARGRPEGGDYIAWIEALLRRRAEGPAHPDEPAQCAREALRLMVARGTVALGDVANETWIAPLLFDTPMEGVLFHEAYSPRASEADGVARAARNCGDRMRAASPPDGRWAIAPSPHAPHTCSAELLRALSADAREARRPLTIHAAESLAEVDWMRDGAGPLARLFGERRLLDPERVAAGVSPIAWLDELGVLDRRSLLVHCVHCSDEDVARVRRAGARIVSCPRSNRYLGVGRAPIEVFLAAGVPVALGTDSLASSPSLDLFDEMATVRQLHPSVTAECVVRMATLAGAEALGLADRLGSLEAGKEARPIAVPLLEGRDPLEELCASPNSVIPLSCTTADRAHAC